MNYPQAVIENIGYSRDNNTVVGMTKMEVKEDILRYWNSKKIIVHRKMTHDIDLALSRTLKYYSAEEVKKFIDFFETILEPGVPESQKKYFWTYKWNLWEFLQRGIKKFDGQETTNYLRKQNAGSPEAIVFKRK